MLKPADVIDDHIRARGLLHDQKAKDERDHKAKLAEEEAEYQNNRPRQDSATANKPGSRPKTRPPDVDEAEWNFWQTMPEGARPGMLDHKNKYRHDYDESYAGETRHKWDEKEGGYVEYTPEGAKTGYLAGLEKSLENGEITETQFRKAKSYYDKRNAKMPGIGEQVDRIGRDTREIMLDATRRKQAREEETQAVEIDGMQEMRQGLVDVDSQRKRDQDYADGYRQEIDDHVRKMDQAVKSLEDMKYTDPFGSFGGRIVSAIGAAMGAWGAAMTRTPNYAMELITKNIDEAIRRDQMRIAKTKSTIAQRSTVLGHMQHHLGKTESAKAMARKVALIHVARIIQTKIGEAKTIEAKTAGQDMLAMAQAMMPLEADKARLEARINAERGAQERARMGGAGGAGGARGRTHEGVVNLKPKEYLAMQSAYIGQVGGWAADARSARVLRTQFESLDKQHAVLKKLRAVAAGGYAIQGSKRDQLAKSLVAEFQGAYRQGGGAGAHDAGYQKHVADKLIQDPTKFMKWIRGNSTVQVDRMIERAEEERASKIANNIVGYGVMTPTGLIRLPVPDHVRRYYAQQATKNANRAASPLRVPAVPYEPVAPAEPPAPSDTPIPSMKARM
jgi:hypothetical protein